MRERIVQPPEALERIVVRIIDERDYCRDRPLKACLNRWRRSSKFWAMHPSLFEDATGQPYEVVEASIAENPSKICNPNSEEANRTPLARLLGKEGLMEVDKVQIAFEHRYRLRFFPHLLKELLGMEFEELERQAQLYDAWITRIVLDKEPDVRAALEERKKAEAQRAAAERTRQEAFSRSLITVPALYRFERYDGPVETGAHRYAAIPRMTIALTLEPEDTHGHRELVQPLFAGVRKILEPYRAHDGFKSVPEEGLLLITLDPRSMVELHERAEELSKQIRRALEFDPQFTGVISGTKAAKVLGISLKEFRDLAAAGGIAARETVFLPSRTDKHGNPLQFDGYAVRDVLDLKAAIEHRKG